MNKFTKTTALALCATTLLSQTAFAAAKNSFPVRATLEAKGYEIGWIQETKTVTIRDGGFLTTVSVGEDDVTLIDNTTYAPAEIIENIDAQKKAYEELSDKVTITKVDETSFTATSEKLGEVVYHFTDETHFHHEMNKMIYKASDLTIGLTVKVYFSEAMTLSLPPQTQALEVVFLNAEEKLAVSENSKVFTVSEKGDGYILASNAEMGEVMFKVDENTSFRHEKNKMLYRLESVETGMDLQITFADAMTLSIPPQVYASDVVFLDKAEETRLSASGEIKEVGENFILVDTDELGEVEFTFDENTNLHHEMNRMFYAFSELTAGMLVTVYHDEAMTLSLPPQSYANEIVILNVMEEVKLTKTGKVTEVGEGYFVIETAEGEYRFNADESTSFHHVMNRRLYRLESLEKDMEVEVIHSDAATFSLPPQSYAIEVIIK